MALARALAPEVYPQPLLSRGWLRVGDGPTTAGP